MNNETYEIVYPLNHFKVIAEVNPQ